MLPHLLFLLGQQPSRLSQANVGEDLLTVQRLIEDVHPAPYFHLSQGRFEQRKQSIMCAAKAGMSSRTFFREITSLVADLGDGHTRIPPTTPEYLKLRDSGGLLFPLELKFEGGRAYVKKNYGQTGPKAGEEIRNVCGVSVARLRKELLSVQSGERTAFREDEIGGLVRAFGVSLYGWRAPYTIKMTSGKSDSLPGVTIETIRKQGNTTTGLEGCSFKVLRNRTGYLAFNSGADPEKFKDFLNQMLKDFGRSKVKSVVIDVRNNPGGDSLPGAMVLESFTDREYSLFGGSDVKVSQTLKDRYGKDGYIKRFGIECWNAPAGTLVQERSEKTRPEPNPLRLNVPMFVLIGPATFSNGMSFASAVKDCRLGTVIGEETGGLGCGYGQFEVFTLPRSGFSFWVSTKHIFRPSLVDDGRGVLPDIEVKARGHVSPESPDLVLEKALDLADRVKSTSF